MCPLASCQSHKGGSDMRPRASSSFCAASRALTASRADCVIVMMRITKQMSSARMSVPIIRKVMKPSCTLSTRSIEGLRPSIVSVIVVTLVRVRARVRARVGARVRVRVRVRVTLMMIVHTKKKQRQKEHEMAT